LRLLRATIRWQYTENEEDGTVSVIDLPGRKLLGKIKTPRPLAGIAISADGARWSRSMTNSRRCF
jgi:DNA-binding beta-propeller fold protein YncE